MIAPSVPKSPQVKKVPSDEDIQKKILDKYPGLDEELS